MKTEAEYKALNDRFDARMKFLCSKYSYLGHNLGVYKFKDGLLHLEIKGSDIMHNHDHLFNYRITNFKLPFER